MDGTVEAIQLALGDAFIVSRGAIRPGCRGCFDLMATAVKTDLNDE